MSRQYTDERFCEHCQVDTLHTCLDDDRSSIAPGSGLQYQRCEECNWYRFGNMTEYEPPAEVNNA